MNRRSLFRLLPGAAAAAVFAGSSAALATSAGIWASGAWWDKHDAALAAGKPLPFPEHTLPDFFTPLLNRLLEAGQFMDEQNTPAHPGRYVVLTAADVAKLNWEFGGTFAFFKQPTYDYQKLGMLDRFTVYGTLTERCSCVGYDAKGEAGGRVMGTPA